MFLSLLAREVSHFIVSQLEALSNVVLPVARLGPANHSPSSGSPCSTAWQLPTPFGSGRSRRLHRHQRPRRRRPVSLLSSAAPQVMRQQKTDHIQRNKFSFTPVLDDGSPIKCKNVGGILKVGSDFAGMAMESISMKSLSINYQHEFHCEKQPHCQRLLRKTDPPKILQDDVLTRDAFSTPNVDVFFCTFPCQPFPPQGEESAILVAFAYSHPWITSSGRSPRFSSWRTWMRSLLPNTRR